VQLRQHGYGVCVAPTFGLAAIAFRSSHGASTKCHRLHALEALAGTETKTSPRAGASVNARASTVHGFSGDQRCECGTRGALHATHAHLSERR
jgi:hypothetical protein